MYDQGKDVKMAYLALSASEKALISKYQNPDSDDIVGSNSIYLMKIINQVLLHF